MTTTPTQKQSETLKPCPYQSALNSMPEAIHKTEENFSRDLVTWYRSNVTNIRMALTHEIFARHERAQPSETPVAQKVREALEFYSIVEHYPTYKFGSWGHEYFAGRIGQDKGEKAKEALALLDQQAVRSTPEAVEVHGLGEALQFFDDNPQKNPGVYGYFNTVLQAARLYAQGRTQKVSHVCDEQCGGAINMRHCPVASASAAPTPPVTGGDLTPESEGMAKQ